MIVMYHKFGYELNGEKHQIDSTMVVLGEDQTYTAMSKTVGLPVAIATLAILKWKNKNTRSSNTNYKRSLYTYFKRIRIL